MPVLKAICASVEVGITANDLDGLDRLQLGHLEKEFGISKITHATNIINLWLQGSSFEATPYFLKKKNNEARWEEMLELLHSKMANTGVGVIEITLTTSGKISRDVGGQTLSHEFEKDRMRVSIIHHLSEATDFVSTNKLCELMESKNNKSILKTIPAINSALEVLHLPQPLIETKRGTGHRINPAYHLIVLKDR